MSYVKIRPRRSTAAEWEYDNPILAEGEWGVEVPNTGVGTGVINVKVGDGVTPWINLPYGLKGDTADPADVAALQERTTNLEDFLNGVKRRLVLTGKVDPNSPIVQPIVPGTGTNTGSVTTQLDKRITTLEAEVKAIEKVLLLLGDD